MNRFIARVAVAFCLSVLYVPDVLAAPITINFAGAFNFVDFEYLQEPRTGTWEEFWAFDDAIRATGAATSAPGQYVVGPLYFSLTFDTDITDLDPSPDFGMFQRALTGKLWLGDTIYSFSGDVSTHRRGDIILNLANLVGPSLVASGLTFRPDLLFHPLHSPGFTSDALTLENFANFATWQAPIILMGFNGGRHVLAGSGQAVSITVPEPSSLIVLAGAMFALAAIGTRSRFRPSARGVGPHWNERSYLQPVQFEYEDTATPRAVRLCRAAAQVGELLPQLLAQLRRAPLRILTLEAHNRRFDGAGNRLAWR